VGCIVSNIHWLFKNHDPLFNNIIFLPWNVFIKSVFV
jgi:hypothetical protein